jgi:cell division protein FtsQ
MADTDSHPQRLISLPTLAGLVITGATALVAVWLSTGLIGEDHWPIQWLEIEGDLQRTSPSQIRAAAATAASHGFFAVSLMDVRNEVEALPWVARANVSRRWPDALHIHVTEHQAVARWNARELLSASGEAFAVSGSEDLQGMVHLHGPDSRRVEVLQAWQLKQQALRPIGVHIEHLRLDERGSWQLHLNTGLTLLLGREQGQERLERFVRVFDQLNDQGQPMISVDLRYVNGLAVRRVRQSVAQGGSNG